MRLRSAVLVATLFAAAPARAAGQEPPPEERSDDQGETALPVQQGAEAPETADPSEVPAERARGVLVVALGKEARAPARELARQSYRETGLRPPIDERTAMVLAGGEPPEGDPRLAEIAATVRALDEVSDESVRRKLAGSLADELGARQIVLVEQTERGPQARVVEDGRYLSVILVAEEEGEEAWRWNDAVAMLRGLSVGVPEPGPRTTPSPPVPSVAEPSPLTVVPKESPGADEGDDEFDLLTSPWFWSGLGVVVSVGVTVLVLSQTSLNEPDVVRLEGMVGR